MAALCLALYLPGDGDFLYLYLHIINIMCVYIYIYIYICWICKLKTLNERSNHWKDLGVHNLENSFYF